MKVYAKQIDPEFQDSRLFYIRSGSICYNDDYYNDICILPRERYYGYMPDDIRELYYMFNHGELEADTIEDLCKRKLSDEEINKFSELLKMYDNSKCNWSIGQQLFLAAVMILKQKPYSLRTICGCCQRDWADILYPSEEFTDDDVKIFETEFFNTGSEWIIHDGNTDPECPEDIDGYSIYCQDSDENAVRAEIASATGCDPADVVLYMFDGYIKTPKYIKI